MDDVVGSMVMWRREGGRPELCPGRATRPWPWREPRQFVHRNGDRCQVEAKGWQERVDRLSDRGFCLLCELGGKRGWEEGRDLAREET